MKLLAAATDQVVRGWWDASRQGRIGTVGRALVVARMTGDMRLELRHPGLRICRQGVTDA